MSRQSRAQLVPALIIGLWVAPSAWASKYTGPKSATVRCKVLHVVAAGEARAATVQATDDRPEIRYRLGPRKGEAVAEVEVLSVQSYDPNGWKSSPEQYIPKRLF